MLPGLINSANLTTAEHVKLDSNGTNTAVLVDSTGGGDYQHVATLKNVGTSIDITILLEDGSFTTVTTKL